MPLSYFFALTLLILTLTEFIAIVVTVILGISGTILSTRLRGKLYWFELNFVVNIVYLFSDS